MKQLSTGVISRETTLFLKGRIYYIWDYYKLNTCGRIAKCKPLLAGNEFSFLKAACRDKHVLECLAETKIFVGETSKKIPTNQLFKEWKVSYMHLREKEKLVSLMFTSYRDLKRWGYRKDYRRKKWNRWPKFKPWRNLHFNLR